MLSASWPRQIDEARDQIAPGNHLEHLCDDELFVQVGSPQKTMRLQRRDMVSALVASISPSDRDTMSKVNCQLDEVDAGINKHQHHRNNG